MNPHEFPIKCNNNLTNGLTFCNLPHSIVKKENMIAALKADKATLTANHAHTEGATFRIELNEKTYNAKDKAGEALLSMVAAERKKISQKTDLRGCSSYRLVLRLCAGAETFAHGRGAYLYSW